MNPTTRNTYWRFARGVALAATMPLVACGGPEPGALAAAQAGFDFRRYFDGTVLGHGLVTDRGGSMLRRFVVTMQCQWSGDTGTLNEDFVYDDGERQHRVWQVRLLPDGRYTARAADVVGEASGGPAGAAFNWRYTLKLPVRGSVYEVQFDDWMYRIDERIVINKVVMTKFGIRVGELTLSFSRP